jgi:hypothetical protein
MNRALGTLQYPESCGKKIIDTKRVKQAVTTERSAELMELFQKQNDLRPKPRDSYSSWKSLANEDKQNSPRRQASLRDE